MLWVDHAFSDIFQSRREELSLEPRRYELQAPQRFERYGIEIIGLPSDVRLISYPQNGNVRGAWVGERYRVNGLFRFSGDIILRTPHIEWRISWDGDIVGQPRLSSTAVATARLDSLQKLWFSGNPIAANQPSWFKTYPTGCTRVLILLELGAVLASPFETARALDKGNFLPALGSLMAHDVGLAACHRLRSVVWSTARREAAGLRDRAVSIVAPNRPVAI